MSEPALETLSTTATDRGRLDKTLAASFPDVSRARFQNLIAAGQVTVNGRTIVEAKHAVKPGDAVSVEMPPLEDATPEPEPMQLNIVYEDDDLLVIDKPAGLVVHPGPGNWSGTLVNGLLAHCGRTLSGIGGIRRPGIVHRLDKDTSGLLVVAKNDHTHASLSEQFAAHGRDGRLERLYHAIVWGVPSRRRATISEPIGRHPTNRQKMAVSYGQDAREAVTHYEVTEVLPPDALTPAASLIECRLETGRTHQIRVHLAHIGHPLLGDGVYGAGFKSSARKLASPAAQALEQLDRQALHASKLGFIHPRRNKKLTFTSELKHDMRRLLDALRTEPTERG